MGGAVQDSQMLRKGIDTSQRILTGGGWLEFKRPVRVAQILVTNIKGSYIGKKKKVSDLSPPKNEKKMFYVFIMCFRSF